MKAVVLCAGFGTRLGDWTRETPKPMLSLAGKPILGHILSSLSNQGFREVAVNLHFQPDRIPAHFGDGRDYGVKLHYSFEEKLSGTAGALAHLASWLEDSPDFLVLYGDILTDQDLNALVDFHRRKSPLATLLLHRRLKSNSIVQLDGENRITRFLERPNEDLRNRFQAEGEASWVNSGIQVVNREILSYIEKDQAVDLPRDLYARLCADKMIFGFPLSGKRIAIDSQERFLEAQNAVLEGTFKFHKGNEFHA